MAEFMPPDGGEYTPEEYSAASGRVPKVSETTVVKGLIGLKQSWRNGQET